MWDAPSNGTFFSSGRENTENTKKVRALSIKKLKELVFLYENWVSDSCIDELHQFICREIKADCSKNATGSFEENMQIYDAACREIARRWCLNQLTESA